ncbi:hypothetical protein MEN41_00835 [Dolichospermum sp. ST_con]|nr:hypothetical protein [Dolichospermum sp. ST_con]MDD1418093.1 hypothetical protein [Dolichospermum sp. ST_sed1]MDD1423370.1 hypothetical protein [Dolichospermum sp. ST_sed9]MDD1430134.1 hypothetical protein [Dolichospermum sp. ST_sed6]MDD1436137.1 hypothetical protein [Dolichospermum sp. ST_sed10]MDD1439375.1 hypothetical protein [Dolichospermum sp. ST_sed3]MDD1445199.1 hypothetical protein [Dolichospermum sp. ST_sed8]MDD1455754.1 hypothetical protein [Dolichospermum sp. ST_sed7]MDD145931
MEILRSNSTKKITYYPLLASLVVVLLPHSTIDQGFTNPSHKTFAPAQFLAQANNTNFLQSSELDAKKALDLVQNLPQVQRKAREIKRLSRGTIRVSSVVESYPTADTAYYIIRVFENHSDKSTSPIYWFRVLSPSGVIEALDLIQNQYIPLNKWNPDGR